MGIRTPATTLRRFWTMLAHQHGGLWQATSLANALGISSPAVARYLDLLCDLFVVRRLTPYVVNVKKRLVKSPKIYLRDSGLLHALLGIKDLDQLLGHPIAGVSFEGMVIEQLIAAMPAGFEACFYRTSAGAELDLLLVPPSGPPLAFEIKNSLTPRVTTGFRTALADLGVEKAWVVYPGSETWSLDETTTVLPLSRIGDIPLSQ
jgi:predicted AAA+ superfamily ATPase